MHRRTLGVLGLLLLVTGCGSGSTVGGVFSTAITITAFVPATTKAEGAEADFSVFVDSAFQAGDGVGASVPVTFTAVAGTPFLGGQSATLRTTATIVSANQLVGLCPASGIVGLGEVLARVRLDFPSGESTTSADPLARFAPPPLQVLGFGPTSTVVGGHGLPVGAEPFEPFDVTGTGFSPVGGAATVELLLEGAGRFCDGATSVSIQATVASPTRLTGVRPSTPVRMTTLARVRVTQASGSATSQAPLLTLTPHLGTGTFADWGQALGTDHASNIAVGDLNGDGYPDLVTASSSVPDIRVFLNDGTGTLVAGPVLGASLDANGARVALGDIDKDGDLDIVRAMYNRAGTAVYRNDGQGAFSDTGLSLPVRPHLHITLGDLDGDGSADVVVSLDGSGARVLLNGGTGTFADTGQSLGSGGWVAGLADFDGGGTLDLAAGSASRMSMYTNDGTGLFTFTGQSLGAGTLQGVAFGDLNADGHVDVVGAFRGGGGRAFLGDGAGAFAYTGQEMLLNPGPNEKSTFGVAIADVDGDCDLDVALGHALDPFTPVGAVGDEVWLNNGSAAFSDSTQRLGSSDLSISLVFADLDRDGDPDLLSPQGGGSRVEVYRNLNAP